MRTIVKMSALPVALVALACVDGGTKHATVSDELSRDLALASAASLDLASEQASARTNVVSAMELTPESAPSKAAAPRKPVKRPAAPKPTEEVAVAVETPTPAPEPVAPPQEVAAPQGQAPAEEPQAGPRPQPLPPVYPGDSRTGGEGGRGPGIGGVLIGVVLRGGGVDGDHCEIHQRGRGGNTAINQRFPIGGGGIPNGTFPRSRGGW
ncbi:MAG: hypothetical protein WKG32_04185 [Gemmatimonadaceae bacterium]